jgi:hypothetical protein
MRQMQPRAFERCVAEIFRQEGFDVAIVSITYMGLKWSKRVFVECLDNIYRKWAIDGCNERF